MAGEYVLPSWVQTGDETLSPEELDEVLDRGPESPAAYWDVELLQATKLAVAVEALDVCKLLRGAMDLHMCRTTPVPGRAVVVGFVPLVAVVFDAHGWPLGLLVDDQAEHRLLHGEMISSVVESHLEGGAEPQPGRLSVWESGDDGNQRDGRRGRSLRVYPGELRWTLERCNNETNVCRDGTVHDFSQD